MGVARLSTAAPSKAWLWRILPGQVTSGSHVRCRGKNSEDTLLVIDDKCWGKLVNTRISRRRSLKAVGCLMPL